MFFLVWKMAKGMMHLMDHEVVNEDLKKLLETEGIDVQLSYDGLRIPITLQPLSSTRVSFFDQMKHL